MTNNSYSDVATLLLDPPVAAHPDVSEHNSPTEPSLPEKIAERTERLSAGIRWAIQTEPSASSSAAERPPRNSAAAHLSSLQVPIKAYQPVRNREETFVTLQAWEGVVLEVEEEVFQARLTSTDETPDQYAEIYLEEVDQADLRLVKPGAVFYWTIGYLQKPTGTTMRASILRFRRLPTEMNQASACAEAEIAAWEKLFADAD